MFNSQFSELRNVKFSRTASSIIASAPTVRSVDTTLSPLPLQLENYELFAVATDGSIVYLGTTASFFDWGATEVAHRCVRAMTKLDRACKRLVKNSPVLIRTYIADIDK
jgi:hypothetical protein